MIAKNYKAIEPRMLSQKQAEEYTGMGRNTLAEFAGKVGARRKIRRKIGKKVLYDKRVIDAALDGMNSDESY